MGDNIDPIQIKTSSYNDAGLQIQRLHNKWVKADYYAEKGKLSKWKFVLDRIWGELFSDVMKETRAYNDKKWLLDLNFKYKKKVIDATSQDDLYKALDQRYLFLRWLQDYVGKGSVYKNVNTDVFE